MLKKGRSKYLNLAIMDEAFHYPPELLSLLVQTIPRLCRTKPQVFLFFEGAGVGGSILKPFQQRWLADKNGVSKYEIAEGIITQLNKCGDTMIRQRREIVKRVTEFEDFTTCWDGDRLIAEGFVAKVRNIVNVKDSFTRMKIERETEVTKRTTEKRKEADELAQKQQRITEIQSDLLGLFSETDRSKRGKQLETVLNRLFAAFDILVTEAFTIVGNEGEGVVEQIDGVISLNSHLYLVEMKWWQDKLGPGDIAQHMVRVFNRGQSRGIFISNSGYTAAALKSCVESLKDNVFVLCELEEIVLLLERGEDLALLLTKKVEATIVHKNPLYKPHQAAYIA
jgi:hypothetical protein